MSSKKGNIVELFIDKAILAIAGLISLGILFVFVVGNPNSIEYAGKHLGPTEIDNLISQKAVQLQNQMKNEPNTSEQYESKKDKYLELLKNSIKDVNVEISFPLPGYSTATVASATNRVYRIPQVGQIEKPTVAVVRMAAFVPTEELSATVTYDNIETKLEDMDLVTVESSIDAKKLYSQFRESFAAKSIQQEWRKEQYAKPVFAKVQLQRKTQQPDGSWSDWTEVPLTKICHLKKNLEIPQQASEYGMEMAMVQFAKGEFRNEILQPSVYYNAIPAEPWISPSFYNERQKRITKDQEDIRRQEIEAEKGRKLQEKAAPSSQKQQPGRPSARPSPSSGGPGETGAIEGQAPARGGVSRPQGVRQQPAVTKKAPEKPVVRTERIVKTQSQDFVSEMSKFNAVELKSDTNPAEIEKLVFWAHDDTTKPGEKYQYRIRIGVFNPIAGTNWFSEEQQNLRDQVVLWSDFANVDPNEVVEIPQRLYFFATDSREIVKGASVDKTVDITIARYTLGNWVSQKFNVKSGDEIGKTVDAAGTRLEQAGVNSDFIDFSTGTIMVDTRRVTEWSGAGSLRSREYYELLYSRDGKEIEKMPIKERYWPAKVEKIFKEITAALDAAPVQLLTWSDVSGKTGVRQRAPSQESPSGTETPQGRSPGAQRSPGGLGVGE